MTLKEYIKTATVGDVVRVATVRETPSAFRFEATVIRVSKIDGRPQLLEVKWNNETEINAFISQCGQGNYDNEHLKMAWHIELSPYSENMPVEIIKKANVATTATKKANNKKRKLTLSIEKSAEGIELELKVPAEIEDYYSKLSGGKTKTSKIWQHKDGTPVVFYLVSSEIEKAENALESDIFSDYGSQLLKDTKINTAILRTKNSSKGIAIVSAQANVVNNVDLEYYAKRIGIFVKKLWERSISKQKIKSVITYEI